MSSSQKLTLFSGVGGTNVTGSAMHWAGGPFVLLANWSSAGSGSMNFQISPDGTNWSNGQNLTINPAGNAALFTLQDADGNAANELPPLFVRGVFFAGSGVQISNLTLVMQGYDGANHVTNAFST
jgi:hypothetical protein